VGASGSAVPTRLQADRPIFIAGLRRSGTTLFYRIMNASDDLFLFNERVPAIGLNGFGEPTDRNIWSVDDPAEFRRTMLRYLSPVVRLRKGFWGVKLPLELAHPDPGSVSAEGLNRIMRAFPRSRVLGIVRDPRDFVLSATKRGGHDTNWWVREYQAMIALFDELLTKYPDRVLVTRYEDLVDQPARTIERCCDFTGLKYSGRMLDPNRWSTKGPREYPAHGVVKRSGRWRQASGAEMEAVELMSVACFPAATRFGYQTNAGDRWLSWYTEPSDERTEHAPYIIASAQSDPEPLGGVRRVRR
jgi:hypothetical protein